MAKTPLFRRIGDFSVRNSGKIIVVWVVLFLVMIPFSVVFFNNVNFNIGGSLFPKNSMTQESSNLQSEYFGSSNGSGSVIVLVSNGTSLKTQNATAGLISLIDDLNKKLDGNNSFNGITSIFGVEKQLLVSSSEGLQLLLNSSYEILNSLNQQLYSLIQNANLSIQLLYGIPAYYLSNFTQSLNATQAYESTLYYVNNFGAPGSPGVPYLNSFSAIWNTTYSPSEYYNWVNEMNSSIAGTFQSTSTPLFSTLYSENQLQYFYFLGSLVQNYSLNQFMVHASPIFNDTGFLRDYSVNNIAGFVSSNSSLLEYTNSVNLTPLQIVSSAYNLTSSPFPKQILDMSATITDNAFRNSIMGSPELSINNGTFYNFLVNTLNGSKNINTSITSLMKSEPFTRYPILPKGYIFHQFVGYDYSTTIILLTFSSNVSISTYNKIVNDVSTHSLQIPGSSFYYSSDVAQNLQTGTEFTNGLVIALTIGIALSILIIGLFFRSPVAAFIPLVMFMFSAVISMGVNGIVYKYLFRTSVSFITPTLLLILLLGLTSDYIVYIMARYRREVLKGHEDAAQISTQWSGNAVFTSGFTVALSYVVLWLSGIPIFSDSGLTNFIGVSITVVLANSLLIALLFRYGDKMFWPARISLKGSIPLEKTMGKVAKFTVSNKKKILAIFAVITLASFYLYLETPTGLQIFSLIPQSSATQAAQVVNSSFNGDFFERGVVILKFNSPIANTTNNNTVYNMAEMKQITKVESAIKNTSGVSQVYGPTFPYGYFQSPSLSNLSSANKATFQEQINSYIGNSTEYAMISFQTSSLAWDLNAYNTVDHLNSRISTLSTAGGFSYYTGGLTQGLIDTNNYAYSTFMETLPILAIAIFFVLFLQLFSLFTPIRLISMVLLSVVIALAMSYGILYFIASMPILVFMPIFTVITLLAVGLDYDIFLITRVREEIIKGASTSFAIRTTIKENGGVIIALGMLLFVTFIALHFTNIGIMDEIGTGLALGVLVDTFISWPFFVPVIMLYMSKYNWWPSKIGSE